MRWRQNKGEGKRPRGVVGKRVHVILNNGYTTLEREPDGWPAEGRGACNWSQTGKPWEIKKFIVIGGGSE